MKIKYTKTEIISNKKINDSYHIIRLACNNEYSNASAGQFIMLRSIEGMEPLLSRPFSIYQIIKQNEDDLYIEILYKTVGIFTNWLSKQLPGTILSIVGPLGNGFKIKGYNKIFIIAGGVGIAPMYMLSRSLIDEGCNPLNIKVFLGGRTNSDILCKNDFFNMGIPIEILTEDGSEGKKGIATDLLESEIKNNSPDMIYACGPMPMLKSVAIIANNFNIPCQVSIETMMACGMGACLGCAVESNVPNKFYHACIDGPVFNANNLKL
ncbi:MAG: dihydroorotate dehydrogenase electron transfer subunit [Desulfobacterales bacterium]|nr:dihydroorotate dehydrogenase electron transfer subunit [Desulfobacterales bacterium]